MAKNFAKKKKGSIAIWQIFEIILFAALVYTFITLWPVFLQKQNVDYIAKTMVRAVETNGRIDSSITDLQHELENEIVNDMKKAMEQKQFKVYFQPQYSIKSHEIIGAEALVRWER